MTKQFDSSGRAYILAEIGTSHAGSIEHAYKLIDAASSAGADGVKFQWVYADEILHPDTGFVPLPGGKISLFETFKKLEVSPSFFAQVRDYARKTGLDFVCSPFGVKSLEQLYALEPDAVKIASPELNHIPLLNRLAQLTQERAAAGKPIIPIIVSTGVSLLADIEAALDVLQPVCGCSFATAVCTEFSAYAVNQTGSAHTPAEIADKAMRAKSASSLPVLTLLHCVTSYPAPETDYNLRVLRSLSNVFGVPCGISDHSLDPVLVPALSTAYGCSMIEKHITLSKTTDGLDDPVALTPQQFEVMVKAVRKAEQTAQAHTDHGGTSAAPFNQTDYTHSPSAAELAVFDTICAMTGASLELCARIAGSGIKKLAASEKMNYTRTNRSIHFLRSMTAGQRITAENISILRTEKVLLPGLHPCHIYDILGAVLARSVTAGKGVEWNDIVQK